MPPRAYDARRRQAGAEVTRGRILEAARAIVAGSGDLVEFSIDAVAQRAGVARMTVYNQFHSKAGLLDALADHLALRGGISRLRLAFGEPSLDQALGTLIETFVGFWASDRLALRRLRAMAVVAPAEASGPRDRDVWRRAAIRNLLEKFGQVPTEAQGAADELLDLLNALTSFETFDALCVGRRTPRRVASLLTQLALREVNRVRRIGDARRMSVGHSPAAPRGRRVKG